jgi:hypothetical protein
VIGEGPTADFDEHDVLDLIIQVHKQSDAMVAVDADPDADPDPDATEEPAHATHGSAAHG